MKKREHTLIPMLAFLILLMAALACGGDEEPAKIGEVAPAAEEAVEEPAEQPAPAQSEETVEEPAEQPAPAQSEETAPEPDIVEEQAAEAGPMTYQVGDIISIGDTVMTVLGWDTPPGDSFGTPEEGNIFVAVDVLFVNSGDEASSVSSFFQMTLKDETDQGYDVDLFASVAAGDSSPDGEMSPGERLRGKVGFQVPEDASGLVFVFEVDIFGTGKAFVELGPEPLALEPPSELAGEQALETFAIGDIITIGDIVMTVLGWDTPPGDSFNAPDEGRQFIAVDVLFVNQGEVADSVSPMLQMSLKDDTGQGYDFDLFALIASGDSSPEGEISPGERIRGKVGFQVPEDATGLIFVFDADIFGSGKVFVDLGADPILTDPPAELEGEEDLETFAVGETIQIGDMTMTVNGVTSPPGGGINQPDEGRRFIVVDVTFENNGQVAETLSTILQMSLKDETGQVYDVNIPALVAADGTSPGGEIAPGEVIRGQVGFQVPLDAQALQFVFDDDILGSGKIFVDLPVP